MQTRQRLWMLVVLACVVGGLQIDVPRLRLSLAWVTGSDSHPFHFWSVKFAEEAGKLTDGKLKVQVFPSSQLGKERDMAEGLLIGTLEMCVVGTGTILPVWVPDIGVLDAPFIYRDNDHFYAVQDGAVGAELKSKLEAKGMKHLGWADIGARNMTNNRRPLSKPADLVGLKMRVPDSKVYDAMMKALGATVVPVNFAELYMALQQGVADGQAPRSRSPPRRSPAGLRASPARPR